MRLIVMRHCKSSWASAGLTDHARPLNRRGRDSAVALGDWLRDVDCIPDFALVSSSQRTQDTFSGLRLSCAMSLEERLYHASAERCMSLLEEQSGQTLLMIGHNPGLAEFAWRLAKRPAQHPRFQDYPTGATTILEFEISDWAQAQWSKGTVRDFMIPRTLLER